MVRIHLFGSQDIDPSLSLNELPSTRSMMELCRSDNAVCEELSNNCVRSKPAEIFGIIKNDLKSFIDDNTEQGIAKEFVDRKGQRIRYTSAFGWMYWDNVRWISDAESYITTLLMEYADEKFDQYNVLRQTASTDEEKSQVKALLRTVNHIRSASGNSNILKFASCMVTDHNPEHYDADPWILNTPQNIINLKTGDTTPHGCDYYSTKITACSMSDIGAELWSSFINHITGGDEDFARYLQTLAGMASIGQVFEEGLVISFGPGGNGKSTFFGVLQYVLGDYARSSSADLLVVSGNHKVDTSFLAALRGVRLAIMGETDEGARFGVAEMKRVTSRDKICARMLYKDPIEFTPTHTVVMHTNHLPKLNSLDGGTRRRIAVAPFPATLSPEKVITNYEQVLV